MNFKPNPQSTGWRHGPAYFETELPRFLSDAEGIIPLRGVINLEVGPEVVLYIVGSKPVVKLLRKMNRLYLRVNAGLGLTSYGPVPFLLFWVSSRFALEVPMVIFDLFINEEIKSLLRELSCQTQIHVFLLDKQHKQHNFWELENTFHFDVFLEQLEAETHCRTLTDFDKAKKAFIEDTTLDGILLQADRTVLDSNGISIFDASRVPDPPSHSSPLRSARFSELLRRSVERHTAHPEVSAGEHLGRLKGELAEALRSKRLLYLDVCHWVKIRQVWLQTENALPIYENIVTELVRLHQEQKILCPVSSPIFLELMKQEELSRAATANLIEIFSTGICVHNFPAALCNEWKDRSIPTASMERRYSALTKIGFWLPEELLRQKFYAPEIDAIWDRVSIDLRWHLSVADFQRLAANGEMITDPEPTFLAKWRDLPAEQRVRKRSFLDLVRECRKDILKEADFLRVDVTEADFSAFNDPSNYGHLPSAEIAAGMCAARVYSGGKIKENDVFDFLHASAGIPAAEAYFCDGPMKHLLLNKPLQIQEHFATLIRSGPDELLTFLKSL